MGWTAGQRSDQSRDGMVQVCQGVGRFVRARSAGVVITSQRSGGMHDHAAQSSPVLFNLDRDVRL